MKSKYMMIYNDLVSQIEKNKLKPNDKLLSENEFIKKYEVSRETIRKALNLLAQNGFIQKIKGKGSFVLDINKFDFPVSGLVTFKELSKKLNKNSITILEKLELKTPETYIKKELNLQNQKIWEVIRVRNIDGENIILDKDYLDSNVVSFLDEDICKDSIYNYLEDKKKLNISFAKKEITVEGATNEDYKLLDMKNFDMVVVVKSHVYLNDASLFQYTESRHRPDKFRFIDFARRNKHL